MATAPAWSFEHSVECNAHRQFAWAYWTDIANWKDGPATFELDGPFDSGSRLTSILPGQIWHSIVRHVERNRSATIETLLPDGVLSFHWTFEDLPNARTRMTQRLLLLADSADLVAQASLLEQSVPQGMSKLVTAIEEAFRDDCNNGCLR